jgi:hypothetical protein
MVVGFTLITGQSVSHLAKTPIHQQILFSCYVPWFMQKFNQHRDNQYYENLTNWLSTLRIGENISTHICINL